MRSRRVATASFRFQTPLTLGDEDHPKVAVRSSEIASVIVFRFLKLRLLSHSVWLRPVEDCHPFD